MNTITMSELHTKLSTLSQDEVILDVRTPEEFSEGHIPGAINIDHEEVDARFQELKKYKTIYVHCRAGGRAKKACGDLSQHGFSNLVCVATGGMPDWERAGFPVEE
jgi:rhodanese-related sulfurtransferase